MLAVLLSALIIAAPAGGSRHKTEESEGDEESGAGALDIAGYFADGPFKEAGRLVARGDVRAAVAMLKRLLREKPDAPERPQARFLLGLSLIQLGDYEEAARLFDELAVTYPALKDDHLFYRGQALYLWGSYLAAAEVLSGVDPSGPRGDEARKMRAWALLKATDFERLARWLEQIEKTENKLDPELAFILAKARHRTGDVLGAYRGLREVWREAPAADLAGRALVSISELRIGDKGMLSDAERSAIHSIESRLTSGKNVDDALADLEKRLDRINDSKRLRGEIAYARGRIAESKGRLMTADKHFERALELAPVEAVELRARAGLEQGRIALKLAQDSRALSLFASVADRFPERPESEDALYHSAEILLVSRKYAEARDRFQALLLKNPVTAYRPKCLWGIGWSHYRLADYERAKEFFGSLSKMRLPAELEAPSRYWLARTLTSLGKSDEARVEFIKVVQAFPLSHYSALAEDLLAEALPGAPAAPSPAASGNEPRVETSKELVQIREYAKLGLRSRALAALAQLDAVQRKSTKRPREAMLRAIARLYDELGQNLEARKLREEIAREYPSSLGSEEFIAVAKRSHPMKFEEEIRKAAQEFGVPDSLLFGLIRTESGFRPDAISNMAAYGLAQLILPTAQTVSSNIKAGRATRARLLRDPAYNARLGAAYLRSLLDRYDGSEPLALAAYNAGPKAVDTWAAYRVRKLEGIGDAGKGVGVMPSPDELAEEISVAETNAFVKNVLARSRAYARLYPRPRESEPEEPSSPQVEVGAVVEPQDLPPPPKDESLGGARVVVQAWSTDPAEISALSPPPPP